jgi:hypothetical protein
MVDEQVTYLTTIYRAGYLGSKVELEYIFFWMSSPLVCTCTWVDFSIDDFMYTNSRDTMVLRKFSSFVLLWGVIRLNGNKKSMVNVFLGDSENFNA